MPPSGPGGPGIPRSGALRWLGTMRVRTALLVLLAATLIGIVLTLLTGREPGFLLGFFVIVGSIIAALGVRRGSVYLFFPLPALVLFIAAFLTGEVHDSRLASSTAGLSAGFLQWVAGVFVSMCVATILTVVIGGGRWLFARQLVSGQFSTSAGRPGAPGNARPAPGARRPAASEAWADDNRFDAGAPRRSAGLRPGSDAARVARPPRDPWGDPRLPGPGQPTARPGDNGRAPRSAPQPRDSASRPKPRDPWDPNARPRRQPRPPRDPWD